ncbi:MAG: hypothetical protein DMG93_04450 [Acidobacteria bacterium]|nr:MAG: hypothetical protein DMG93_04450 [Acidobacteriota bacterium]
MNTKRFFTLLLLSASAAASDAAIPYFARSRSVVATTSAVQNYVVIDSDVWKFARPDLADIRLYDGEAQVPYALIKQSGGNSTEETSAKVLNLGTVAGHTEFDLDVSEMAEYDQVRLQLDAKNFLNRAQVEGRKALTDRTEVNLGSSTLYDFTAEGLGSNSNLKFSAASFPYLHVRLASGIRPNQIKGAYLSNFSETKAAWIDAGQCLPVSGLAKQSTFECTLQDGVPLERIAFDIAKSRDISSQRNFSRTVQVQDERETEIQSGSISRVFVKRAGETVSNEDLAFDVYSHRDNKVRVIIENRDDEPLPIQRVHALSYQRRIYFDPRGKTALRLYYGDGKLGAPSYDYQQFFEQNPDATAAQLGPAEANARFTGRPDDRPWSERHGWILWAAMLIAVLLLAATALRGLKSTGTPDANRS